jgi:proteic killer suppression protein
MRDAAGPLAGMIVAFKNNGLADLFATGKTGKINKKLPKRVPVRPARSDVAERPDAINLPGCDLRAVNGFDPTRYPVHVNGPFLHSIRIRGGQMLSVWISGRITKPVNTGSYVRPSRKRCPSHSRALPDGIIPASGKTKAKMARLRGLSRQHS